MGEGDNDQSEPFPRTVEAAVELVMSRLTDDMKVWLRHFKGDETDLRVKLAAGLTPGMSVRGMLGLWDKNRQLLMQLPPSYRHPDEASMYFLIECWRRLRRANRNPNSDVLVGQILTHESNYRLLRVRLDSGEVIAALLPKSRKFGCLFGSLVGWNVKVKLCETPKPARVVQLKEPTQTNNGA